MAWSEEEVKRRGMGMVGWSTLEFQNWYSSMLFDFLNEPSTEAGYDCMTLDIADWSWSSRLCDSENYYICVNHLIHMTRNHTLVFRKASLLDPIFHFWWNNTTERSLIKEPAFKIDWKIRNVASYYHVMDFVSKDMSGSVSTPGLGSIPPSRLLQGEA